MRPMNSLKRPRSNGSNQQSNQNPLSMLATRSKVLVSAFLCIQLLSAPSSAYSFSQFGRSFMPHKATSSSRLFAVSSTSLSTNNSVDQPKSQRRSKKSNIQLFKTYNEYKSVQERISELNLSDATLAEKAAALSLSQTTLENILVNGYNSRQTLLLDNIPLVHHTVRKVAKHKLNSLSREDLIQEGTIGLIRAIDKFDASLGNAFSTYAVYWIRASVLRCIQQREDMIRVPEYLERAIRKVDGILKEEGKFNWNSKDLYASVDLSVVAQSTGLTERVVKEAMKVKQRRVLQASRKEGYSELQDYMMNGAKVQQENDNGDAREGQLEHFKDILGQFLSMKEMEAISWRYGLLQDAAMNIPEPVQVDIRESRDYEAEAENDLFGEGGILASSINTSSSSNSSSMNKPRATITIASKTKKVPSKGGRWGEAMSFKEVGENMRVSAEYGRRLCSSAMKKLQSAAEDGRLDPAMLF